MCAGKKSAAHIQNTNYSISMVIKPLVDSANIEQYLKEKFERYKYAHQRILVDVYFAR